MSRYAPVRVTWITADGLESITTERLNLESPPMVLQRAVTPTIRLDKNLDPETAALPVVERTYELAHWGPWPYIRYAVYREVTR